MKQIALQGRLDTANASAMDAEIAKQLQGCDSTTEVILDGSHLEYISSTGLRIVLKYKKLYPNLCVENVSAEVFSVFEMTGFTRIIPVTQSLREVSVDGCPVLGKGGIGTVYRLTEDTILKVFREGTPLSEVQHEINLSREAFVYGLPTAISFEPVRVGSQYGIIHELINAQTLSHVVHAHPSKAEYYGAQFGQLMKQMHAIHDDNNVLPDAEEETLQKLDKLHCYFSDDEVAIFREIYQSIPKGNSVLHCDLHPKNVMLSNDELILIDMGEVCHGHPLQDLSHTCSSLRGLNGGNYMEIIGMEEEECRCFYDSAIRAYFDTDDEVVLARRKEQIRVAALVRNFSWLALSDSFPQELIDQSRQVFVERVTQHLDEIRRILPDFATF